MAEVSEDGASPMFHDGTDIAFDPYFNQAEHATSVPESTTRDSSMRIDLSWSDLFFSVPLKGTAKKSAALKAAVEDGGDDRAGEAESVNRKAILQGIGGSVKAGQMLAILGPSGSGKTSLIQLLAGRATATKGAEVTGHVLVNGKPRDYSTYSHLAAYCQQDDDMFGQLTVREQITYAANLRLPGAISQERKALRVENVISEMGLSKVADSQIGDETIRGISGGERKRVSIATELVADSSVLFLDEPTSGLDSFNALNVVSTLRRLASSGRTVVSTIHQPRSSIFSLFDMLLVLSEGRTMYFGPAKDAVPYFTSLQFPAPSTFNPADFFLDLVSVDPRSKNLELDTQARIRFLGDKAVSSSSPTHETNEDDYEAGRSGEAASRDLPKIGFQRSWFNEFRILASRAVKIAARSKVANIVRTVQTIFFGLVLSLLWAGNGRSTSFDKRFSLTGMLFFQSINFAFIAVCIVLSAEALVWTRFVRIQCQKLFSVIFDFPSERSVVTRERASATYRTSTYYVSKMLTEMPRSIFFSLLSTLVVYWSIGFKNEFPAFLRFFLVVVGIAQFGEALAIAISIATGNAQTSAALAPVCVIVSVLFAGFFTETNQIPVWVRWIKWISFVFYAFNAFAKVEFPGRPFGQEILDQAGFNSLSYWENMAGLFGLIVALRLVGYLSLKYLKGPKFLKF